MFLRIVFWLFVLVVGYFVYAGGIPRDRGDANEKFARVAQELKAMQDESVDRSDAVGSVPSQQSPSD